MPKGFAGPPEPPAGAPGAESLIVDVGQSGMRFRSLHGATVEEWDGPPLRASDPRVRQVVSAVVGALRRMRTAPSRLAVGSSGLDDPAPAARALAEALDPAPARIIVAHDSVSAHVGALSGGSGVVLAVGTGTVCLASGPRGVARVDGWGALLGDGGSGYWLGRLALSTALKDLDGRRMAPLLRAAAEERFGELKAFAATLSARADRVSLVAAFASEVVALARRGDDAAAGILREGAVELAESAVAGLSRAGWPAGSAPSVSYAGSLLAASEDYRRMLVAELAGRWPTAQFRAPDGTPLDGAARLLDLDPAHPLHSSLAIVGAPTT